MVVDKGVRGFLDQLLQSLIYNCFQGWTVLREGGGGETGHRRQRCVAGASEGHGSGTVVVGNCCGETIEMCLGDKLWHGGNWWRCGGERKGGVGSVEGGGGGQRSSCSSGPDLLHSNQVSLMFSFLSSQNLTLLFLIGLLLLLELLLLSLLLDEKFSL